MTVQELIDIATKITQENISKTENFIGVLTNEQRTWKPDSSTWNMNEIYAHLNKYADYYHRSFKEKIEGTKHDQSKEKFLSSPLGRAAWRSMKLGNARNVKRKFKALPGYNPATDPSLVEGDDLEKFVESQKELLKILNEAKHVNMKRVKIPVSISKIIRLRLGDALLFVIYHNERHVQQAINLFENEQFPK